MPGKVTTSTASQLKRGDELRVEGWQTDELVRDVKIVLQMSNGMDLVLQPDDEVQKVIPQ